MYGIYPELQFLAQAEGTFYGKNIDPGFAYSVSISDRLSDESFHKLDIRNFNAINKWSAAISTVAISDNALAEA